MFVRLFVRPFVRSLVRSPFGSNLGATDLTAAIKSLMKADDVAATVNHREWQMDLMCSFIMCLLMMWAVDGDLRSGTTWMVSPVKREPLPLEPWGQCSTQLPGKCPPTLMTVLSPVVFNSSPVKMAHQRTKSLVKSALWSALQSTQDSMHEPLAFR